MEGLVLSNIELQYFPANCTSLIQPLDKGIINSVKCAYRRRPIAQLLLNIRLYRETKTDIFRAIEMLAVSWQEIKTQTIVNCFRMAQIVKDMRVTTDDGEEEPSSLPDLAEDWSALCTNGVVPDSVQLSDFLYADNCTVSTEEVSDQAVVESIRERRWRII